VPLLRTCRAGGCQVDCLSEVLHLDAEAMIRALDDFMAFMAEDMAQIPPHVLKWEGSRYVVGPAEAEYMESLAAYEHGQCNIVRLMNAHLGLWDAWMSASELYHLTHDS